MSDWQQSPWTQAGDQGSRGVRFRARHEGSESEINHVDGLRLYAHSWGDQLFYIFVKTRRNPVFPVNQSEETAQGARPKLVCESWSSWIRPDPIAQSVPRGRLNLLEVPGYSVITPCDPASCGMAFGSRIRGVPIWALMREHEKSAFEIFLRGCFDSRVKEHRTLRLHF